LSAAATDDQHGEWGAFQRERIMRAMVEVAGERGYAGATVGLVVAHAGVSRRTFYGYFASREACVLALLDLGLERIGDLVGKAFAREDTWQDGVRSALASVLGFLDSEPLLARMWLVESLAAGRRVLERRERNLGTLRQQVVSSWPAGEVWTLPALAAEGAMASVLGIIHSHILSGWPTPLIELLGPLMGSVAAHYLPSRAVALEIERGQQLAREIHASNGRTIWTPVAIPAVLSNPNSHRARRCLLFLAEHPQASNREIATGIGVAHASQISHLLSCLLSEQLVARHSAGVGKRNAWWLTSRGEEVAWALRSRAGSRQRLSWEDSTDRGCRKGSSGPFVSKCPPLA
jgi:AcrR family transcriptional regulator